MLKVPCLTSLPVDQKHPVVSMELTFKNFWIQQEWHNNIGFDLLLSANPIANRLTNPKATATKLNIL